MIYGSPEAVRAVRAIVDKANGLPIQGMTCQCGAIGMTIVDDDSDVVRCASCGLMQRAGDLGLTLRVYRDTTDDKGVATCECPADIETAIAEAKAKPDAQRTKDEKVLATVSTKAEPKPAVMEVTRG